PEYSGGRAKISPMVAKALGESGVSALQSNELSPSVSPANFPVERATSDRMSDVALERVQFSEPDLSQEFWCSIQQLHNHRSTTVCETKASKTP
ncbi:MAG: hypothetical protein ACR2PA_20215, partial [Hyphomicrobiaceae bacterium]